MKISFGFAFVFVALFSISNQTENEIGHAINLAIAIQTSGNLDNLRSTLKVLTERLDVDSTKSRLALVEFDGKMATRMTLEAGSTKRAIDQAINLLGSDSSVAHAETESLDVMVDRTRKALSSPSSGTVISPDVVLAIADLDSAGIENTRKMFQVAKNTLAHGGDMVVFLSSYQNSTPMSAYYYWKSADAKIFRDDDGHDSDAQQIGSKLHDLIRQLVQQQRAPRRKRQQCQGATVVKRSACYFTSAKTCVADIEYDQPTDNCPTTADCPTNQDCETTCEAMMMWSECEAKQCREVGSKSKIPDATNKTIANCPEAKAECKKKCDPVSGCKYFLLFFIEVENYTFIFQSEPRYSESSR